MQIIVFVSNSHLKFIAPPGLSIIDMCLIYVLQLDKEVEAPPHLHILVKYCHNLEDISQEQLHLTCKRMTKYMRCIFVLLLPDSLRNSGIYSFKESILNMDEPLALGLNDKVQLIKNFFRHFLCY